MFSCKICEVFKNTFFTEYLWCLLLLLVFLKFNILLSKYFAKQVI